MGLREGTRGKTARTEGHLRGGMETVRGNFLYYMKETLRKSK